MRSKALVSLLILASTQSAFAQTDERKTPAMQPMVANPAAMQTNEPGFSVGGGAIPALPLESQQSGTVTYLNGGIGDEELAQLKAQSAQYNLQVMLSAPGGAYISDVRLRVLDDSGKALLDIADAGPYLYAKLPAGTYKLETTNPGAEAKTETVKIPATGAFKKHIVYNQ